MRSRVNVPSLKFATSPDPWSGFRPGAQDQGRRGRRPQARGPAPHLFNEPQLQGTTRPRRAVGLCFLLTLAIRGATLTYQLPADAPGPWPAILSSLGLLPGKDGVIVAGQDAAAGWATRVEHGAILIVEGDAPRRDLFRLPPH